MLYNYVQDIRDVFIQKYNDKDFSKDTLEIQAASFIANEDYIFGTPNQKYIDAELKWYRSKSLNVDDIAWHYGKVPAIWKQVADDDGYINSNYGWCIYSLQNGQQYKKVMHELSDNPNSRQATMYYTRPTMHEDATANGMSDHMCTYAVSYHLNHNVLDAHVYMRSNDAVFGYANDVAWQKYVLKRLCIDLSDHRTNVKQGNVHWHASSLHVYPRHYHLVNNV